MQKDELLLLKSYGAAQGAKVIRSDGLFGTITSKKDEEGNFLWIGIDGDLHAISRTDDYYLIGHKILGNRVSVEDFEKQVEIQRAICEKENAKLKTMRKQLWYLQERMGTEKKEKQE